MSDATDLLQARAVLHEFDLGPLKPLDIDDLIRRGHRRRRATLVQATAVALVVLFGVAAGIAAVQSRIQHAPSPATTDSPTLAPSPSVSPTTVAERVDVVMAAVAAAESVHIVTPMGGGSTLDVVVTQDGAHGTLTHAGKTSEFLGVNGSLGQNGALYVKPDALGGNLLSAAQVRAAHGRWVLMTGVNPLNKYMNLLALSQSFYPAHGTTPSLGQTRTINGIPTVALTSDVEGAGEVFVEVGAPYQPLLGESGNGLFRETFSDWDAPAPKLPSAPSAANVYKPFG